MSTVEERIADFVGRRRWAVVGVSSDPAKFGYKIFATLLQAGYEVYGVNKRGDTVLGQRTYPTLADLPVLPEVVDLVVPPKVSEEIVRQCEELGIKRVWMQPGAESPAAIAFCEEHGIEAVWGVCAMVLHRTWPQEQAGGAPS